jgi:hypothetical protein
MNGNTLGIKPNVCQLHYIHFQFTVSGAAYH